MNANYQTDSGHEVYDQDEGYSLGEIWQVFTDRWLILVLGPLLAGLIAFGMTFLIAPTFTARLIFMPPQQAQSGLSATLASLGQLGVLAGAGTSSARGSVDQYIGLMRSGTVSDRIVDEFKLMDVYDEKFRVDARKQLNKNVQIVVGRKDGLITVDVDDVDPQRAASIANRYVEELRRLLSQLAITEAQQRRVFFEQQLNQSSLKLVEAQQALQASGFSAGALKAEPRAAAEGYARLKAEVTAAEVKLQVMRGTLADTSSEVQQQQRALQALRSQLSRLEGGASSNGGPDYISRYREFKYQETLFELYARQLELARVDESRESALIQVIDAATPPERKSKPSRGVIAILVTLASFVLVAVALLVRRTVKSDVAKAA